MDGELERQRGYRARRITTNPLALNGQRQIINPGSIGQPRDQNPDAAYGILDLTSGVFEHRRIPYNIRRCSGACWTITCPNA